MGQNTPPQRFRFNPEEDLIKLTMKVIQPVSITLSLSDENKLAGRVIGNLLGDTAEIYFWLPENESHAMCWTNLQDSTDMGEINILRLLVSSD